MKKILKIISLSLLLCFTLIFSLPNIKINKASALSSQAQLSNSINSILSDYVKFNDRTPGSDGEKQAAEYIKQYLDIQTNCVPLTNSYITNGVQSFRFESILDSKYYSSQNIIYKIPSKNSSSKRVLITCSYDAVAYKYGEYLISSLVSSESVNQSAGSVALLLTLANYLSGQSYDYDIEFIFFGAGASNNAGSEFYTSGISNEDASNILLAINLDTISVGKELYFYVDEVETDFSKYVSNLLKTKKAKLSKVSLSNLGKILLDSTNELGLDYTHIALTSNNVNFMKSGVLTMNIFAGDYSSGISIGRNEYSGNNAVTFTDCDSREYITSLYGENSISENLYKVYEAISTLLDDSDFVSNCESSFGQTNLFYTIFANERLVLFLTIVAFLLFIVLALLIHYKLTVNAYFSNIEKEFVSSVLKITGNVDKKSENDEVPKTISEIIAEDIKKDKRIKKKKK